MSDRAVFYVVLDGWDVCRLCVMADTYGLEAAHDKVARANRMGPAKPWRLFRVVGAQIEPPGLDSCDWAQP